MTQNPFHRRKDMTRLFSLFITLLLVHQLGSAQTKKEKADSILNKYITSYKTAGYAVAVSVNNEVVWSGVGGMADVESNTPVKESTTFRIASLTKAITAVAALQLVEKGKIDLNAPIQTYLPDYPVSKKGQITTRHLLNHTSGIRHYRPGEASTNTTSYKTLLEATKVFRDRRLAFKPGSRYKYTSYGYTVLGAIIEEVSGQSFQAYLKENILEPSGMTQTEVEDRQNPRKDQSSLYQLKDDQILPAFKDDLSRIYSAGGLVSTVFDMLKFVSAFEEGKLLSAESMELMMQPISYQGEVIAPNSGIGWNIWENPRYGKGYSRVGGQSGASALLVSYREAGVTVCLTASQQGLETIWDIVTGVALVWLAD